MQSTYNVPTSASILCVLQLLLLLPLCLGKNSLRFTPWSLLSDLYWPIHLNVHTNLIQEWSSVLTWCMTSLRNRSIPTMGPVRLRHNSHGFGWQSIHSVHLAGWQAKMASIETWIPWRNAHKPHPTTSDYAECSRICDYYINCCWSSTWQSGRRAGAKWNQVFMWRDPRSGNRKCSSWFYVVITLTRGSLGIKSAFFIIPLPPTLTGGQEQRRQSSVQSWPSATPVEERNHRTSTRFPCALQLTWELYCQPWEHLVNRWNRMW